MWCARVHDGVITAAHCARFPHLRSPEGGIARCVWERENKRSNVALTREDVLFWHNKLTYTQACFLEVRFTVKLLFLPFSKTHWKILKYYISYSALSAVFTDYIFDSYFSSYPSKNPPNFQPTTAIVWSKATRSPKKSCKHFFLGTFQQIHALEKGFKPGTTAKLNGLQHYLKG